MRYEISINGQGYVDYTIKEDGTLVSGAAPARAVLVTYIRVIAPVDARGINRSQSFALFALLMQLNKSLSKPLVTGDLTWDEIVAGAK